MNLENYNRLIGHDQRQLGCKGWRGITECRFYSREIKMLADLISENHESFGSRVLDIGCAQGNYAIELARRNFKLDAIDADPEAIQIANKKKLQFFDLNFLNRTFDYHHSLSYEMYGTILMGDIIEHVPDHHNFLKKVVSILKPGGKLIITTPKYEYLRNSLPSFTEVDHSTCKYSADGDGHYYLFKKCEIVSLIESLGLEVLNYKNYRSIYGYGALKLYKLHSIIPRFLHDKIEDIIMMMQSIECLFSQQLIVCQKKYEN